MRLPGFMALLRILLAACAQGTGIAVTKSGSSLDGLDPHGAMLQFGPTPGLPVRHPNDQLAQDFLDLVVHMESGLALPLLTRFAGPIILCISGAVPPSARADLAALVARLQSEAGLALTILPDNRPATLTLDFERRALLHRIEPSAACFVIPNVSSLAEYRAERGREDPDWARMRSRTRATLFLPADTSPQEVRDCLPEETAQALGPVNDLNRLADSVFNDDSFQSVLTGFDMLMWHLHYAPELASGMSEAAVAAKLSALLARVNLAGDRPGSWAAPDTPRVWLDAVSLAVNPDRTRATRVTAANRSLGIAPEAG